MANPGPACYGQGRAWPGWSAKKAVRMCDLHSPLRMQMSNDTDTKPKARTNPKVARPPLYKVMLVNDDYTPREFVVRVLKAEFRITEDQANRIMITAHTKGSCVVAVFTQDVAETKATRATDMARGAGFPLLFTIEPEE